MSRSQFSQLEAGDRVNCLLESFEAHVVEHPFIEADSELKAEAEAIAERLGNLYQAIFHTSLPVDTAEVQS